MSEAFEKLAKQTVEAHENMRSVYDAIPVIGERTEIKREGKLPVEIIIHKPSGIKDKKLPVFFDMHGGGFVAGDAILMESFCRLLSERLQAVVININYKKAPLYPYPYAVDEVYDVALNLAESAALYGIDPARMAIGGHSAGGYLAAAAVLKAKKEGRFAFACQLLVYPCTDLYNSIPDCAPSEAEYYTNIVSLFCPDGQNLDRSASPVLAEEDELAGLCPSIFVICENDFLRPQGEAYAKRLIDCGVPVAIKRFKGALHGFLEVNQESYAIDDFRQLPEQELLTRSAEDFILKQLKAFM